MVAAYSAEPKRRPAPEPRREPEEVLAPTLILTDDVRKKIDQAGEKKVAKPQKRKRRWLKWSLIGIFALLLAGAGYAAVWVWNLWQSFESQVQIIDDVFGPEEDRPIVLDGVAEGAQTVLLLGSDKRAADPEDDPGRFDTMMVVHVPADRKDVVVMSIMRDNWVTIPGYGENKINAAMSLGGIPLVVKTIEAFIDTRIDHVAIIDFEGFRGMSTALGGVTINNPKAFTARNGDFFAEGEITLKGNKALTFVRERKAFIDGDYTRVKNQQLFIKGLLNALMSAETLTNPLRLTQVVDSISPYLEVDRDLNFTYIALMAFELRELRGSDVTFFTSPTRGTGWVGNQSVVLVDWDSVEKLRAALRGGTLVEYVGTLEK